MGLCVKLRCRCHDDADGHRRVVVHCGRECVRVAWWSMQGSHTTAPTAFHLLAILSAACGCAITRSTRGANVAHCRRSTASAKATPMRLAMRTAGSHLSKGMVTTFTALVTLSLALLVSPAHPASVLAPVAVRPAQPISGDQAADTSAALLQHNGSATVARATARCGNRVCGERCVLPRQHSGR